MSHQHKEDTSYYEIFITRTSFNVLSKCTECNSKFKLNNHGFNELRYEEGVFECLGANLQVKS